MNTIALVAPVFLPSTQTFIYDEITGIRNYNIAVLTLKRQNESQFPFKNVYVAKSSMSAIKEFSRVIKQQSVKLIHFQFGTSALYFLELKKISGLPMIVTFHGFDASSALKRHSTLYKYQERLFPAADHIIAVSQKLKDNLVNAGCPKSKITVLSNGIDTVKFSYTPRILNNNQAIKILCIARLTEKKGIEYLIESFAKVNRIKPDTELLIVGQGDLKPKLQQQISNLGLIHKVKITDFVPYDEIPTIIHQHHIFCLPSVTSSTGDEEGLPTVLKEACATGMPVISTYHSGIPELIKDEKNGFLVHERKSEELAHKLIYLIDHPEVWQNMGFYGRKHVEENFDKFKQTRKLENIYSNLIENQVWKQGHSLAKRATDSRLVRNQSKK